MQISTLNQSVWPKLVYPLVVGGSICLYFALLALGWNPLFRAYIPVALAAAAVAFFEYRLPHSPAWKPSGTELWNDALYMVTVQMLLPKLLSFLAAVTLLQLLENWRLQAAGIWPHHWPIGAQAVLMVLISDFLRYWLHRLSHENLTLWKLHAVHHSPQKLYWVNVGRFHPIEKALQFQVDALPFIIVGVSPEVLGLYFVFYAVNGFLQHCNIELKMGPLNYIISSAELHRWHHSRKIEESNHNYGNNIIIWDLLFGTYLFPRDRQVRELGLINKEYPASYISQFAAPFAGEIDKRPLPLPTISHWLFNLGLAFKMRRIHRALYKPLIEAAKNPAEAQARVLRQILSTNRDTDFARKHRFSEITDYNSYITRVPVHDYESLRPYIEQQDKERRPVLTRSQPIMYNQTSGTTGKPKYIPVLPETIEGLKRSQQIFSYIQYQTHPGIFRGKILGIVSPAIEGRLESGTPFGSASGLIYKAMPKLLQSRYVLPSEVFEIEDYDARYYLMARLALEEKDITYAGCANPSTFHRFLEVINACAARMMDEIEMGSCHLLEELPAEIRPPLRKRLRANKPRAGELRRILASKGNLSFADAWPCLKWIVTWTGGSCGISLGSILPAFPPDTRVIELGYLASELRGAITIDPETQAGLPTLEENFFEFVERDAWENGTPEFITLERLQPGRQYYIFVTTPAGLYRYHINDIIEVTGLFENTPTFRFTQKGKGVTSITGEKLHESQLMEAMERARDHFQIGLRFYQAVASELASQYEIYVELAPGRNVDAAALEQFVDDELQRLNLEYASKRRSGRLKPLRAALLRPGSEEVFKKHLLARGQREGQFKCLLLHYKKEMPFPLGELVVS